MKSKVKKSGEFYIVAAIIISMIVISLAGIVTYTVVKNQPRNSQDISSDLREETPRILDYGIYNGTNITSLVENFTDNDFASYFSRRSENSNVTFIYGDKEKGIKGVQYTKKKSGSVSLGESDWDNENLDKVPVDIEMETDPTDSEVNYISILNKRFKFRLKRGDMFYFVLTNEKEGEYYVEK